MSIILFGYYGFDNVGDEQLLDESIKLINELSLSVNYCVANGPYPAPFPTFNRWNPIAWVRQLSQAKTLIFGGGSIFQSSTSFYSLLYYLLVVCLARLFRCRVVLLCQGWGPFNKKWHETVAKKVLQSTNRSWRLAMTDSEFLNDPVFCDLTLTQGVKAVFDGSGSVGICFRTMSQAHKLQSFFDADFSSVIPLHCESDGASGGVYLLDVWNDHELPLSLVLTDRFHGAIWATRHGIPWVGISTDPKLVTLAESAGQNCYDSIELFMQDDRWCELSSGDSLISWARQFELMRPKIREWLHAQINH